MIPTPMSSWRVCAADAGITVESERLMSLTKVMPAKSSVSIVSLVGSGIE
jgi:hypothetical protein